MTTILHLKSGISYIGDNTLVVMEEMAAHDQFARYNRIVVPVEETYAANCIRVNDRVLFAAGYPRTADQLTAQWLSPAAARHVGVSKNGRRPQLSFASLLDPSLRTSHRSRRPASKIAIQYATIFFSEKKRPSSSRPASVNRKASTAATCHSRLNSTAAATIAARQPRPTVLSLGRHAAINQYNAIAQSADPPYLNQNGESPSGTIRHASPATTVVNISTA